MIVISKIDYRIFIEKLPIIKIKPVTLLYFLCIILQIYVLIFGEEIKGAKRWIQIGDFASFQPSELTKLAVILLAAYIVNLAPRRLDKVTGFLRVIFFISPLLALVAVENFSTALVIGIIMVSICFVASRKKIYFIGIGLLFVAAGALLIILEPFRVTRIDAWINVETHDKGYQILQGLYAIASGGIFGKGLGEYAKTWFYLNPIMI